MRHTLAILVLSASVAFGQTLTNTTLDGVSNATINSVLYNDAAATRTALGLGTAATADKSTTGGADKIPQFDGTGDLRIGPVNPVDALSDTGGELIIPNRQRISWENAAGSVAANLWLYGDHSGGAEWLLTTPRFCLYWDHGMQLGQAGSARSSQFTYFQSYGQASADDTVRESVPVIFKGETWTSGARVTTWGAVQWVPTIGTDTGTFQFGINTGNQEDIYNSTGRLASVSGVVLPFSISEAGPKVGTGKVLTFSDNTTLSSTDDIVTLIDSNSPVSRVGNATLVAGTADVTDASVTGYTQIFLTRKTTGGTAGHLSYVKDAGVKFTINSSSNTETSSVSYLLIEGATSDVAAPTIAGTTEIGDTLTLSGGSGAAQWYSNGVLVSGETASTYVIRPADIGLAITVQKSGVASNSLTAWHPDDESGYYADYRNDVDLYQTSGGSAATVHADPVGSWKNQAGNYAHIEQATSGYRPSLDTTTYASYPHLRFDGTDDYLTSAEFTPTLPQTVFVVAETVATGANKRLFSMGEAGERMLLVPIAGDEITNGATIQATTSNNDLWPVNTRGIVTGRTTTTNHFVRVNSGTEYTSSALTALVGGRIMVGGTSITNAHNCRVFGVLVYQATLDDAAQARVRKYLKAKYGTP